MKPKTNPETISELKEFLLSQPNDVYVQLYKYARYLNQGIYEVDNGVVEIAKIVSNNYVKAVKTAKGTVQTNFANRLIFAFEKSKEIRHIEDKTILIEDIKIQDVKPFEQYEGILEK